MTAGSQNSGPSGRAPVFTDRHAAKYLKRGFDALVATDFKEASACAQIVLKYKPKLAQAHFLVGLIAVETSEWGIARKAFAAVVDIDKKHAAAWAQLARTLVRTGHFNRAHDALAKAVKYGSDDPLVRDLVGTVYELIGDQDRALEWYEKACRKDDSPMFKTNLAKALIFHGRFDEARTKFEEVLEAMPHSTHAHWFLSRVGAAKDKSHIDEMQALLKRMPRQASPNAYLYYALGKEYEDLEMWPEAFKAYEAGAKIRRANVSYDETREVETFKTLKEIFTKDWLAGAGQGCDDPSPIFIVGQPRTGTTLVERIITARDDVHSAGELQQFGLSVKRMSGVRSPGLFNAEIVRAVADTNMKAIGDAYMDSTRSVRSNLPRFVDKLPVNYMYAPLIAAALPNAKIVHLCRDPMDACFASYKQLFAEAYYHSYDQGEMARHHLRYRDLMEHYRQVLGERMIDVVYEEVVTDLEGQSRRLIEYLGLEWQDASLEFHKQDTAVTTASAAQVRETAHSRSVGRWKKFESELAEMSKTISAGLGAVS